MPQGSSSPMRQQRFPRTVSLPHPRLSALAHPVPLPGDGTARVTVPEEGGRWRTPCRTAAPRTFAQPDLAQGMRRLTSAPARPSWQGRPAALASDPAAGSCQHRPTLDFSPTPGPAPQPHHGPHRGQGTPTPAPANQMFIFSTQEPRRKSVLGRGGGCRQRRAKAHPSVATQP